jgi:tryptophan synthase alpha chain
LSRTHCVMLFLQNEREIVVTTDRIAEKFAHLRDRSRTGLFPYLMAGFPSLEVTEELVPALVEAGADGIEIGVPFSDPLADGATIQAAGFHALQQGVTLADCVNLVQRLRDRIPDTPLMLMGYYNPILSFGLERFCQEARSATVDGLIVPDLPAEEAGPLSEQSNAHGIHVIPLLAPTSTEERIGMVCAAASGFIYCVSVTGVTGARDTLGSQVPELVERVRRHTSLPVSVGFGVSTREHLQEVGKVADAVMVGSALVRIIQDSPRDEIVARASRFVEEMQGAAPAPLKGGR